MLGNHVTENTTILTSRVLTVLYAKFSDSFVHVHKNGSNYKVYLCEVNIKTLCEGSLGRQVAGH